MSEENLSVTNLMENNEKFQPAEWIESLASILASFLACKARILMRCFTPAATARYGTWLKAPIPSN